MFVELLRVDSKGNETIHDSAPSTEDEIDGSSIASTVARRHDANGNRKLDENSPTVWPQQSISQAVNFNPFWQKNFAQIKSDFAVSTKEHGYITDEHSSDGDEYDDTIREKKQVGLSSAQGNECESIDDHEVSNTIVDDSHKDTPFKNSMSKYMFAKSELGEESDEMETAAASESLTGFDFENNTGVFGMNDVHILMV